MKTSRATFHRGTAGAVLGLLLALTGCSEPAHLTETRFGSAAVDLAVTPPTEPSELRGELPLDPNKPDGGSGILLVPDSYNPDTPAPVVVLLHGAGGTPEGILTIMKEEANASGTLVVAPKSVAVSWDMIALGRYNVDVAHIELALQRVFREYSVDPQRVSICGFSDGASYALSVGLTNGELFRRIVAFSPGFVAASELRGKPSLFITHGTQDKVLPIETGGRYITEQLRKADYSVDYREFDGPHAVPKSLAQEAFNFLIAPGTP
ncbi:phospholipase [Pyxidicoccus parkwayensis]|uniref:Phospholipase n=1 Tax=Pyxidicoccus parkwayensis TaxID=2813578 RepID=A0ABX7P7V3_9BACT|nr:alpha/beta hydrolase-fold protein [Pyxidicoccus parkwaysis]QSQ26569.1 phospholipase [Pyxidicoccus parkwaysis]